MVDKLKRTLFATIGVAVLTKDKVEELGKHILQEASMSEEDGKKFVEEFVSRADEARDAMETFVKQRVDDVIKTLDAATRDELAELRQRVEKLEEALAEKK
jgi:polyhydroxyalkanoate synthesis regulator phasin